MKHNNQKLALLIVALLIFILLPSCRPEPVEPQEGQVLILAPSAGDTITSSTITVRVFVENFTLVEAAGQPNQSNQGHIIYYLDVKPPLDKGQTALSANGTYAVSAQKTYEWSGVSPGEHNLWVQLVNNDDTPLEPAAAVRVPVSVR